MRLQIAAGRRVTTMSHRLAPFLIALTALSLLGCQTTTGRTAGAVTEDTSTTAAVKSQLVADRPVNLSAVGVDTVNGTVYLTGVVDTPDQRLRAEQLAWNTHNVRQVVNNIQVQRPGVVGTVPPAASPVTATRRSVAGTVTSVDTSRNQVTVATGSEQLLLQLPAAVVQGLRPGDQINLDVSAQPVR
jgi:hyperosmotically inducible periplasmic protein